MATAAARPLNVTSKMQPGMHTNSMRTIIPVIQPKKQHLGNALIELGKQVQQLRRTQNEIEMERVESRLMKLHLAIVIVTLINFVSAISEQEISWRSWFTSSSFPADSDRQTEYTANTLKIASSAITVVLECMLVYMYILFNQLRISKSELESKLGKGLKDSRFSVLRELLKGLPYQDEAMTKWHPNWLLLIEMMIFSVHPFPYVHGIFNLEVLGIKSVYQVEQVLLVAMFLRFYTVIRYLRERQAVQMRPFRSLLNGYGMFVSTKMLVKRFINLHPFRFVMMVYALNYIINIYCLRMSDIAVVSKIGQKTTSAAIVEITTQPMYVWNNMWMIQSSISTVGYGDQYPFTHFGRFFVLFAVFTQICIDSFTVATMNTKTSMSLIEATITKQLSLIMTKRLTKTLAATLIHRWWRYHQARLAVQDRKNHVYGRGYGLGHSSSSSSSAAAHSDAALATELTFARLRKEMADHDFTAHTHMLSKLKRPLEGGDTETIFAALSGTFDQAFEIFFSNLGTVVNAVAGPAHAKRLTLDGMHRDSVTEPIGVAKKISIRTLLSERMTKMAFERVSVGHNRQRPLINASLSPFLKAESQSVDTSALVIKSTLVKMEQRLVALERGVVALEKRAAAKRIDKVALRWARDELNDSLADFAVLCRLPRVDTTSVAISEAEAEPVAPSSKRPIEASEHPDPAPPQHSSKQSSFPRHGVRVRNNHAPASPKKLPEAAKAAAVAAVVEARKPLASVGAKKMSVVSAFKAR